MALSLKGIKFDTRKDEVDTLEAIRQRRSIRRYTDDAIPKADLATIVDAGRLAATGSNRQPGDFVGVAAEMPTPEKRPLENVLHWEKY